ncbi:sigma-70 family RNA polymerase sigma factor [Actinosynnema sp. NPDC023794]
MTADPLCGASRRVVSRSGGSAVSWGHVRAQHVERRGRRDRRRARRAVHPVAATAVHDRVRGARLATESDDVLQDSYLRWAEVDLVTVRDTRSYLGRLVTRQALDALRASARRREEYVGPWLPEPVLLDENDASADVVLAESVSMAMLVVLETLAPDERVVFVLREVFGFAHGDIAAAVGKPVATVRQAAHRARKHVQAGRRRFEPADTATTARITEQFLAAAGTCEGCSRCSRRTPPSPPTAAARPARHAGRWSARSRWPHTS